MTVLLRHLGAWLFVQAFLFDLCAAQVTGEECLAQFRKGQEDFILDTDVSVKAGATFLSSPKLTSYKDCVSACCKEPRCNVAFMERGDKEGLVNACFLFDCLYKKKNACRFVKKKGYMNYIQSDYDSYLEVDVPPSKTSLFYVNIWLLSCERISMGTCFMTISCDPIITHSLNYIIYLFFLNAFTFLLTNCRLIN